MRDDDFRNRRNQLVLPTRQTAVDMTDVGKRGPFARLRMRAVGKRFEEENDAWRKKQQLVQTLADYNDTLGEYLRSIERLKNIDDAHRADAGEREIQLLDIEERVLDARLSAKIRETQRQRAALEELDRHDEWLRDRTAKRMGASEATVVREEPAESRRAPNQAERELEAEADELLRRAEVLRITRRKLDDFVARCGGLETMSPDDKALYEQLKAKYDRLVEESGLG